jgi:hypothetical protein
MTESIIAFLTKAIFGVLFVKKCENRKNLSDVKTIVKY